MAGYLQAALGLLMETAPPRGGEALTVYARQGAAFLQQNYSRSIGVEEAARQAGVSRSCLYRAFQAEFGCSPSAYLIRYRIPAGHPAAAPQHAAHQRRGGLRGI